MLGQESNAWFNFASFADRTVDEETQIKGLSESVRFLRELVRREEEILDRELGGRAEGEGESGVGRV